MQYQKSLFVFRRDLRLEDNTGLIHALESSEQVSPCFFLDPRLLFKKARNTHAISFLIDALQDLAKRLEQKGGQLHFFQGIPEQTMPKILNANEIQAVFTNRDYTPFSWKRDTSIHKICEKMGISYQQYSDGLLNEPEIVRKANNTPYVVFTPFFQKARQFPQSAPRTNNATNYSQEKLSMEVGSSKLQEILAEADYKAPWKGCREDCLKILHSIKRFQRYEEERNFPALDRTTHLSVYLKFGLCSIREVFSAISSQLGQNHPLIRQLFWREFYMHIAYHYPYVYRQSFRSRFEKLKWNPNPELFEAWCKGQTGFPIVDAGMQQLNTTGYMHNRVRMIVASFLTKDLHINWKKGERYFAKQLVDYDPALNNGNWQWAASTGSDAQPYFRIFNPWRQQEEYDRDCQYIKTWIPQLEALEPRLIHSWYKVATQHSDIGYHKPIVNHDEESRLAKELYSATYSKSEK